MHAFYNIPQALVAERVVTLALANAAVNTWTAARDAGEDNTILAELWEKYEELSVPYHEALTALKNAWLDAWRAEAEPMAPVAGLSVAHYKECVWGYCMRSELVHAISIAIGYTEADYKSFWQEKERMDDAATLCRVYMDARREQIAAEAERERLIIEWERLPVGERKSTHPIFCARVACCERIRRSQLLLT